MIIKRAINVLKRNFSRWSFQRHYKHNLVLGKQVFWRSGFSIIIENDGQLVIGDHCLFNFNCSLNCLGEIRIGDHTILGEGVKIYDHNHRFNLRNANISDQGMSIGTVRIGRNCWIGSNVVILKGAEIGDNCVIGAGCVVSGKIPSDSLLRPSTNYSIEKINYRDDRREAKD